MFTIIRIFFDFMLFGLSLVIAYLIRFDQLTVNGLASFPFGQYANYLLVAILLYLVVMQFCGMYRFRKGFLIELDEFIASFFSITLAWGSLIVLTFIRGEYEYSRPIILLSWPISMFSIIIVREIILSLELFARSKGYGNKKAAIIGVGELAKSVADKIKAHPSYGAKFIGYIGKNGEDVLGKIDNLDKIVDSNKIQILYVADQTINREKLAELASFCDQRSIALGTIPDIFQILTTSPSVEDIEGVPIISLKQTRFNLLNRLLKRFFDILLSLFGIVIFSIPMLIITILIKIFSPGGPAIYHQERVGEGEKVFNLLKFRTMIPDAEENTGPVFATENDSRKTFIGKILRSTNLDELLQLFNILKGDMSFVGPRPERPVFVEEFKEFIPKYMERHKIRPGLAGWAQLHGGYHMPAEEKIKYDLYYIENWSFLLDIKIILKYIQIAFTFQRRN